MDDSMTIHRNLDNILNDPERGSKKNLTRLLNHNYTLKN